MRLDVAYDLLFIILHALNKQGRFALSDLFSDTEKKGISLTNEVQKAIS